MFRVINAFRTNLRKRLLVLLVLLGAFVVSLSVGGVLADTEFWPTRGDKDTINGCVNYKTGALRIIKGKDKCSWLEYKVQLASAEAIDALTEQVEALEARIPDCLSVADNGDAVFEGCNVHIRNGDGSTATKNGTGNLIVGYNENSQTYDRTGSHNIVVGIDHGYSSYGGLVVGLNNQITGIYSSISGGDNNEASGENSSVSGGSENIASFSRSSVSGGIENRATAHGSSVSGGKNNLADGNQSSISGGVDNVTENFASSVSGGENNLASGFHASVGGGANNTASFLNEFLP